MPIKICGFLSGFADFPVFLRNTAGKSVRNENSLSEDTSFANFLLAPYTPPLRIINGGAKRPPLPPAEFVLICNLVWKRRTKSLPPRTGGRWAAIAARMRAFFPVSLPRPPHHRLRRSFPPGGSLLVRPFQTTYQNKLSGRQRRALSASVCNRIAGHKSAAACGR